MIISVTERGTFKRCRKLWDYTSTNRRGLAPLRVSTALSLGGLVHRAHELSLLNEDEDKTIDTITLEAAAEKLKELKVNYKKAVGVEPHDEELSGFTDQAVLAIEMMGNYIEKWGPGAPEGMTLIAPEQTILVPIPGTAHEHIIENHDWSFCAEGVDGYFYHQLEGTLDGLLRDEGGRLWILEHKTYENHPNREDLDMNDQFLAYIWLLEQLQIGPVAGVLYDGMWKRPRQGARKERTLEELFDRHLLTRSRDELEEFGRELALEAQEMSNPDLFIYRNRPFSGCWDCKAFRDLCVAEMRGEDVEFTLRTRYVSRKDKEWLTSSPLEEES